jgi:hypothetical protein
MVLGSIEPGKDFHHIINLPLILGSVLLQLSLVLDIEQLAANHKLLPLDSLIELEIVNLQQFEFHGPLLFSVIVIEFHLS